MAAPDRLQAGWRRVARLRISASLQLRLLPLLPLQRCSCRRSVGQAPHLRCPLPQLQSQRGTATQPCHTGCPAALLQPEGLPVQMTRRVCIAPASMPLAAPSRHSAGTRWQSTRTASHAAPRSLPSCTSVCTVPVARAPGQRCRRLDNSTQQRPTTCSPKCTCYRLLVRRVQLRAAAAYNDRLWSLLAQKQLAAAPPPPSANAAAAAMAAHASAAASLFDAQARAL